jgi:hypothetical protein
VRGQTYELAPGASRLLENQPVGPFTYELVLNGVAQGPREKEVTSGGTFIIRVFPRTN